MRIQFKIGWNEIEFQGNKTEYNHFLKTLPALVQALGKKGKVEKR